MRHDLKILPDYFKAVCDGKKTFEVRKNDRDYKTGDYLNLREWEPEKEYTGHRIIKEVTYLLTDPEYVKEGYVILGLGGRE